MRPRGRTPRGEVQRAAKLHQAKAPLVDAQLTKAEIRELSRRAGLSTWDEPAFWDLCLYDVQPAAGEVLGS